MPACLFLFNTPRPLSFSPCFSASSKVLFPFTFSSRLTPPVRLVQILPSGRGCLAGVREVGFSSGRLQEGAEVDSWRTAENPSSTHVTITLLTKYSVSKTKKKKEKKAKPDDESIICQSLNAYRKSPQSPADTLLPCIINEWQLCSPMDSTWNMMQLKEVANICHNGMYNKISNANLMHNFRQFNIK